MAGAVGGAVGDTISGVVGGILSSPVGWLIIGVGIYFLLGKDGEAKPLNDNSKADRDPKFVVANGSSVLGVNGVNNLEV